MTENKLKEKDIFRLAVVLYADDSYNSTKDNIIKKILESLFLNNNDFISIADAIDKCQNKYGLCFSEDEISNSIEDNKIFEINLDNRMEKKFCLKEKRLLILKEKNDKKDINEIIKDFFNSLEYENFNFVKNTIHKFLYEIFTTNLNSYSKVLNRENIFEKFSVDNSNYSDEEKNLINKFIEYKNSDKDKAVFNVVSLALEYCIISGSDKQIYTQGIKNKVFYLDTNIIYRAIGINGDERKRLTIKFIEKCKECNITLKISKYTNEEFNNTLSYYIKQISRYKHRVMNYDIYDKYCKGNDIYKFYYKWQNGRITNNIVYFQAHVKSLYSEFLKKFDIKEDFKSCSLLNEEKNKEEIQNYKSSISTFKECNIDSSNEHDAKNIIMIELLRKKFNESQNKFLETKHFFISTDKKLREWNSSCNIKGVQPVILMPSQWLSIMLRFTSRTSDDFKSFVSFLSLRNNDDLISSEKFNAILCGVSEITEDLSKQEMFIKEIIELKAKNIIELEDLDSINNETIKYVKESMDEAMASAEKELAIMNEKNEELIQQNINNSNELEKEKKEKIELEEKVLKDNISKKVFWWKFEGLFSLVIAIIALSWALLHWYFIYSEYNLVTYFWKIVSDNKYEGNRTFIYTLDYVITVSIITFGFTNFKNKVITKSRKYNENLKKEKEKIKIKYGLTHLD